MKRDSRILVTGCKGLVGSALVDHLKEQGYTDVVGIGRADCNLMERDQVNHVIGDIKPNHVFHGAARVYGIMGNMRNKALSFYENVSINTNVIHACHLAKSEKITVMGTGAVYPFPSPQLPLVEEDIFDGRPHGAEDSYAQAKRAALAMLEAYQTSYGMKWAYVVSCNLFGPRDKFDTEFGHVVPSLVKKFCDAKNAGTNVTVWGNGSAQRDFLYVKDCARAIEKIMAGGEGPINIGSGRVYKIYDIVTALAEVARMEGRLEWDESKPNGQGYRAYDLTKLNALGFKARYDLKDALQETWDWYSASGL